MEKPKLIRWVMSLVIAVHITVLGIKIYAYFSTQSAAILSDALEGIVNLLASIFASISLWISSRPPDTDHLYGHGKIEYFAVGFEGALIVIAAGGIFWESISRLIHPVELSRLDRGTLLLATGATTQLIAALGLFWTGKKTHSLTLRAEGYHILSDVLSTVAVIIGLTIVILTGYSAADSIAAIAMGIFILGSGINLVKEAFAGLMDTSDPEVLEKITEVLKTHRREYWIDIHQLRARRHGNRIFIDLHLILPRNFHLWQAHFEAKQIEELLRQSFPQPVDVLVHLDPCEAPYCQICRKYECEYRKSPQAMNTLWDKTILSRTTP
ncbi:MAG: cation diffusion facilitator family transporter [Syntrophobacterales bacterium]|nr:cation diffusion facilitator family transporter [Syntrophobacterales bacterium]